MASGVGVSDECVQLFNDLKIGHKYRYCLFKLNDDNTEIVLDKTAEPSATYEDFQKDLPEKDCRYGVFDFEWDQGSDGKRTKVLFVVWAPDVSPIKSKMLYTSSKSSLKQKLVGIGCEIQATDAGEIEHSEVLDKVTRGGTTA